MLHGKVKYMYETQNPEYFSSKKHVLQSGCKREEKYLIVVIGQKSPHHHDFRMFFEHYTSILSSTIHFSPKQKKTFLSPIFPFLRSILLSTVHFSTKQANKEKSSLKLKPLLYIYFHYHMPWRPRETLFFLYLIM